MPALCGLDGTGNSIAMVPRMRESVRSVESSLCGRHPVADRHRRGHCHADRTRAAGPRRRHGDRDGGGARWLRDVSELAHVGQADAPPTVSGELAAARLSGPEDVTVPVALLAPGSWAHSSGSEMPGNGISSNRYSGRRMIPMDFSIMRR